MSIDNGICEEMVEVVREPKIKNSMTILVYVADHCESYIAPLIASHTCLSWL